MLNREFGGFLLVSERKAGIGNSYYGKWGNIDDSLALEKV
jgi:hypothetical protein